MKHKHKKGMTLVEVLVSTIVCLLLMGIALTTLIAGKKMWQASIDRGGERQDVSVALFKIAQELRQGKFSTVSTNSAGFCFLSARNSNSIFLTDANGQPYYTYTNTSQYILYYKSGSNLYRNRTPYVSGGAVALANMSTYQVTSGATVTKIIPNVSSFSLNPSNVNPVTVNLSVQVTNKNGKTDSQSLSLPCLMQN